MKPPPTLGSIDAITPPALLAMAMAGAIAVIDGTLGAPAVLTGLLALPPVIAATRASFPETGIVSVVCVVLGVLSGLWNMNLDSVVYVVELLTVMGGAVVGLWVSSLRVDLRREQDAFELLGEAGSLIEDPLDRQERADHLADLAVPALGDVAMVDILDEDGTVIRMASKSRDPQVAAAFAKLRERKPIDPTGPHPVAKAIKTGETIELGALTEDEIDEIARTDEEKDLIMRHRFRSALIIPLKARGGVFGTLTLWIMRSANAYDTTSRQVAERLASRAGTGIDNARLHEQQSHIAAVLQHSLRPRSLPEIEGFELASSFLAAGEAYEVGGDFYDAFRTGSRSWSIVIGDVCGKGPEAAALTSLARYTVRTASDPKTRPSSVLRVLHESIQAEHTDMRFCTAALLRVEEPQNGDGSARLIVSLGGHPPPLILRANGDVEAVGDPGSLLGALPNPELSDAGESLAPGESLILYTDGMLDARNRRRGDEQAWLRKQAAKLAGSPPDKVAGRLTSAAVRRHGGQPRDDIAVIVLQRASS